MRVPTFICKFQMRRALPTGYSWEWMQILLPVPEWRFMSSRAWEMLLPSWMDGKIKTTLSYVASFQKFYLKGQVCANPCPQGTYGVDCKNRCDCYNGALCDHVSGQCHCLPGFQGEKVIYIWKFSNTLMSDLSDSVTQKYSRRKIIFSPYFFSFIFSSEKKMHWFSMQFVGPSC